MQQETPEEEASAVSTFIACILIYCRLDLSARVGSLTAGRERVGGVDVTAHNYRVRPRGEMARCIV